MPNTFGGAFNPKAPTELDYVNAVQGLMDKKAQERRYDNIASAITYRGDPNQQFASEAEALFNWRSAVWCYAYGELEKVKRGERVAPTVAAFLEEVNTHITFDWN